MSGLLENTNLPYIVGGGVVILTTWFLIKKLRGKPKKNWPRDTVIIHQIGRGPWAPSLSPFPLKLETYLRMAKIPYTADHEGGMSKKGKTPWITYNDDDVADSHFCIEYLNEKFGIDLNSHLTPEQKAIGRAFQILVEDNLYWVLIVNRWIVTTATERANLMSPPFPGWLVKWVFPRMAKKQVHSQGMGRHTVDEVWHIGRMNLDAISAYLGKKKFLFGDKASQFDCSVFGMVGQFYWQMPGSPLLPYMKEKCPNLIEYCERMKETFWPDWDDYITHGKTKLENVDK